MGENKVKQYDTINNPSHYHGKNGMEAIDVIENFIGDLAGKAGWAWGNSMKYLLRFQKKNGADVNVGIVYHCLGNGINKSLTHKFIDSDFNMEVLYTEMKEVE